MLFEEEGIDELFDQERKKDEQLFLHEDDNDDA